MLSVSMYLTAPLPLSKVVCETRETVSAVFSHCVSHAGLPLTLSMYLSAGSPQDWTPFSSVSF